MWITSIAIMFIITVAAFTNGRTFDVNKNKKEIKRQISVSEYKRNNIFDLLDENFIVQNEVRAAQITCGQTRVQPRLEKRIVGGIEVRPHSWPSMVSFQLWGRHFCGGTLIHPRVVLTAAHCVVDLRSFLTHAAAMLGVQHLGTHTTHQKIHFKQIIIHPQYDGNYPKNDIALVVLQSEAKFNSYIQPACLPTSSKDSPPVNSSVNVVGWGLTKENGDISATLLQVTVPILDPKFCKYTDFEATTEICAGELSGGKDSCQGDNGGPLFAQNPDTKRYTVYGIMGRGDGCARPNLPGIYTRVAAHLDFINNNIPK